jgi:lipopolysaccharide export system permease protein
MTRLTLYLTRLFAADALALFGVAAFLLFLVQCLRSFDVVSVKGQDLLTLIGQVMLTMPTLAIAFLHVCIAIGLARALRTLQQNNELQIIHSSRRVGALFRAIAVYALGGVGLTLLLTNVIEPTTRRSFDQWMASIAADLVSRTLMPQKFVEVTPGVTLMIGSRAGEGDLGSFFADDARNPEFRRTYMAESANVAADDEGYVLRLTNGSIQYMSDGERFSEVSFTRYDLVVERLTGGIGMDSGVAGVATLDLIKQSYERGTPFDSIVMGQIGARFGEGFRGLALCLLVAAIAAFPHGRRGGREVPIEIVVLGAAFAERAISANYQSPIPLIPVAGAVVMFILAAMLLAYRLRSRFIGPQERMVQA